MLSPEKVCPLCETCPVCPPPVTCPACPTYTFTPVEAICNDAPVAAVGALGVHGTSGNTRVAAPTALCVNVPTYPHVPPPPPSPPPPPPVDPCAALLPQYQGQAYPSVPGAYYCAFSNSLYVGRTLPWGELIWNGSAYLVASVTCNNGIYSLGVCRGYVRDDLGCFTPETELTLSNGETRKAREISAGDSLLNPLTGRPAKVIRIVEGLEKFPLIRIQTISSGGDTLSLDVTRTHPMVTPEGYKQAKDISVHDQIMNDRGVFVPVHAVEQREVEDGQRVINFILNDAEQAGDVSDLAVLANGIATGGDFRLQTELGTRSTVINFDETL